MRVTGDTTKRAEDAVVHKGEMDGQIYIGCEQSGGD